MAQECDTGEVGTTTETTDNDIGVLASHFHLFLSFQSDNGLMQHNVV